MNEKLEKARQHLRENRRAYVVGAVCLVTGAAGALLLAGKADVAVNSQIKQILSYKPEAHQTVVVVLEEKANLSKPVRVKGTDMIFASQNEAARQLDIPQVIISKHLNGKLETANGVNLEWLPIVGEAQAA